MNGNDRFEEARNSLERGGSAWCQAHEAVKILQGVLVTMPAYADGEWYDAAASYEDALHAIAAAIELGHTK